MAADASSTEQDVVSLEDMIWGRQYAAAAGEDFQAGAVRVGRGVAESSRDAAAYAQLITSRRFIPGGRILAGAGSAHGNLLNCFVQDGSPFDSGTTTGVLLLARKLALVTKVGGGNGVNLDPIPARRTYEGPLGTAWLTIQSDHADYAKVRDGTFMDLVRGKYETRGYRFLRFTESSSAPRHPRVITVDDSIDGIWTSAADMVNALLEGEDVLVDLSRLRPEGEPVKGSGGSSSGPGSFAVEIFENFARWASLGGAEYAGPVATLRYVYASSLRVVRQAGVRRGAGMATLSADHPDLLDFITSKDLEREAAEGDISTFNISVLAGDAFMRAATEGRSERELGILQDIARHAWQTGEPGVIFIDAINEHNPLAEIEGPIMATNPCGEIPLYPGEPCDLGAINLAAHVVDGRIDTGLLTRTARQAVRFLDDVLTAEQAPLPEIHDAIQDKRRIGLGVMGLADMLISLGVRYDSDDGRAAVRRVIDTMREAALAESADLALERGVPAGVQRAGLDRRNIAVFTVAPTGTTSMLAGVSGGVEPVFAATYTRRIGTEYVKVVHPLLQNILAELEPEGKYRGADGAWDHDAILDDLDRNHGSLQPLLKDLPSDPRLSAFVIAHDVAPRDHVLMQAIVQRAFDWNSDSDWRNRNRSGRTLAGNSISKTCNLPNDAKVTDVLEAYELAWQEGCKGITVYRDGSRDLQVLTSGKQTDREEAAEEDDVRQTADEPALPPQLPVYERQQRMTGVTDKVNLVNTNGVRRGFFITVNSDAAGAPREVFIVSGKAGDEANGDSEALGRVVSIALQYGVPAGALVSTLRGISGGMFGTYQGRIVTSKADLIAVALETAVPGAEVEAPKVVAARQAEGACPHCGGEMRMAEGCQTCTNPACGWSRCS